MSTAAIHQEKSGFWHMPKAFYAIFFIEFWERFAFYGMQAVAVLFFIQKFGLKESEATDLFSSFSGLLYGFMLIGGLLGDKVLGLRRTYLLGIIFLMIGYGSFAFTADVHMLYWGMGMILAGNVFFKTNAGNFVQRCFRPNDPRLDSAFTYFYMSINLGSFFSMVIIPIVAEKTSYGFGIGLCGAGMGIALLSYFILHKYFVENDNETGKTGSGAKKALYMIIISAVAIVAAYFLGLLLRNPHLARVILFSVGAATLLLYFVVRSKQSAIAKKGMMIALILLFQSIFFWVMYMQMSTSLMLFAVHNVRTDVLGIVIPPAVTQSFNPFYIFLLSPILAVWYVNSENKGKPISIPTKFAGGLLVCGLAYVLLAVTCYLHDDQGKVSMLWLFLGYGLYSLGELLISAIGLSMVSKLIPARLGGFAQAVWFVTTAVGQKVGGLLAGFATVDEEHVTNNLDVLHGYQTLFAYVGISATVLAIIFFLFVKPLTKAMQELSKEAIV
ncbi:MAG: MFS transporter [Neisseriaceae bacterium]|nr:MAG: MFS transporter [Neisseriaceae bacterium]